MPIVAPPCGGHVSTGGGSRSTFTLAPWSPRCLVSGGARNRLAVTFASAFLVIHRCGCVMKVSIKLSINRTRASCGPRGWLRIGAHRCVLVGITAERTGVSSVTTPSATRQSSPMTKSYQNARTHGFCGSCVGPSLYGALGGGGVLAAEHRHQRQRVQRNGGPDAAAVVDAVATSCRDWVWIA